MKKIKSILLTFCLIATALLNAQTLSITYGGASDVQLRKEVEYTNFLLSGNRFYISRFFETALLNYDIYSFNPQGQVAYHRKLEFNPGVFNNTYEIRQIVPFANTMYAMVEHLDKAAGKNTFSARAIDALGIVSDKETVLNSVSYEKTINSGINFVSTSPSNQIIAVACELPYEKEISAKIKYATYDASLKKLKDGEITIPGENTKNKRLSFVVSDNGTLYLIRQTTSKNGEMILDVYQWTSGSNVVKEYNIDIAAPAYPTNYVYTTNASNELLLSGTWYERKTVSAGDQQASGIFFFSNKGLSEKNLKVITLDKPISNLTPQHLMLNGNTVFLIGEQFKSERETPAATAALGDFNYNITHGNNLVIALDAEGNKKFQLEMVKNFTARNFDQLYQTSWTICNGKLTAIYNDERKKYIPGVEYGIIPLLVQITNDGLMQAPVIFKDELAIPSGYTLFPQYSVQDAKDQVSLLMSNGTDLKLVTVKVTD